MYIKMIFNKTIGAFPALERNERLDLVRQLEQSAQGNIDFIMMMIFSTSLASYGLLADSTAVVIGAMLVAPLMGPLVAAGHSLVQANLDLFRKSIGVTALGLGIGLAASLILGVLNIGFEPTLEIESRGTPDLLDLAIGLFSGMTAAYATGRSNVMTTLAGVAIAAALVPPLAVVGIALTHGNPVISGNAAILLITNLVAIILGAALVFRLFGVNASRRGEGLPIWARRFIMLLFILLVLLSAPLLTHRVEVQKAGQNRPLQYPVSVKVREAVKEYIKNWPNVEVMTLGRNSVEPESGITIILMSKTILSPDFEEELIRVVQKARGGEPVVRIFPVLAAR